MTRSHTNGAKAATANGKPRTRKPAAGKLTVAEAAVILAEKREAQLRASPVGREMIAIYRLAKELAVRTAAFPHMRAPRGLIEAHVNQIDYVKTDCVTFAGVVDLFAQLLASEVGPLPEDERDV